MSWLRAVYWKDIAKNGIDAVISISFMADALLNMFLWLIVFGGGFTSIYRLPSAIVSEAIGSSPYCSYSAPVPNQKDCFLIF